MSTDTTEMTVSVEAIGPAQAREYLAANHGNRPIREKHVTKLVRDMTAGRWTASNDAISFASDGTLINGQHRLAAIERSGLAFDMLVVRNMPKIAQGAMDTQSSRTAGDALTLSGVVGSHGNSVAAAARILILIESARIYSSSFDQAVSSPEVTEYVAEHDDVYVSVRSTATLASKIPCAPRVAAVAHCLIARENGVEMADHFFKQLVTPVGEPEGSAVHAVSARLRAISSQGKRYEWRHVLAMILRGWNKYAAGQSVASLPIKIPASNGEFRLPEVETWSRPNTVA